MSQSGRPWETKWQVLRPLGKGGQGTTRLVRSVGDSGLHGVVKTLNRDDSMKARGRMRREVVALDTLAKEGVKVPRILDSNIEENWEFLEEKLYFVMEFIAGRILKEEVQACGPLSLEKAASLICELCAIISAAHKNDVLHRDLKPDNIVVRDASTADLVVVDYGLTFNELVDDGGEILTQTEEQFRNRFLALPETNTPGGDRRDKRSDITALAAIFYYCLTGHEPGHLRDGRGHAPHRRDGFSVRRVLSEDGRCEQIEAFFDRAFSVEMENRFQSIEELQQRLEAALKPPPDDEDPVAVAAEIARVLRMSDRRTLLAEFNVHAQSILNQMAAEVGKIYQHLQPTFSLSIGGGVGIGDNQLPLGVEKVAASQIFTVVIQPHGHSQMIQFVIGAKGKECVLLRGITTQRVNSPSNQVQRPVDELHWFTLTQDMSVASFIKHFRQSIVMAMRELRDVALLP